MSNVAHTAEGFRTRLLAKMEARLRDLLSRIHVEREATPDWESLPRLHTVNGYLMTVEEVLNGEQDATIWE